MAAAPGLTAAQATLPALLRWDALFVEIYPSPPVEISSHESTDREFALPLWAARYFTAVLPAAHSPSRWQRCECAITSSERPQVTAVLDCTITDIEPITAGQVQLVHGIVHQIRAEQ